MPESFPGFRRAYQETAGRRLVHVIGVTGMPGSGKSVAVQLAKDEGLPVVRMGDLIWEEVERQGLPLEAQNVGRVADAMRKSHGPDVWALRTVERIRELARDAPVVLIDGVRSMDEVAVFRRELGSDFRLVAVTCPTEVRFARMMGRGRDDDPDDEAVLQARDDRELSWGIGAVIDAADVSLENTGALASFQQRFRALLD